MAIGKNKRLVKKKGGKKKIQDPFVKKEWYDVRAPSMFQTRLVGKTPISRTQGTKIASEEMKGRVFEINLADLNKDDDGFRKIKLICEDVQGKNVLTNFYGCSFTRDKMCSLIKKWQTLIEAFVDIKTTDGYSIRMFCIAFTKRVEGQIRKTCYATSAQVRAIRKKMVDIMSAEASKCELKDLVAKLLPESIGKEIEKACHGVYPLQNVFIHKVKILKSPKFDLAKLMEVHGEGKDASGAKVDRVQEGAVEAALGAGGRY
eukprot:TRINITY_DN17403_c0_g1_i1.p1 TRINITY_DN17403_c0_g1~~TRINITY_DN17403_c0_g1_i1.p1  ORF type:complete len:268 (+),score=99.41 TRINITY_DN17403_c0_g1_i1:26-805(+)